MSNAGNIEVNTKTFPDSDAAVTVEKQMEVTTTSFSDAVLQPSVPATEDAVEETQASGANEPTIDAPPMPELDLDAPANG